MALDNNSHGNLWLSIGSTLFSFLSGLFAHVTKENAGWLVSFAAAIIAIYAACLTIKEKRLNIRMLEAKARREEQDAAREEQNNKA